MKARLHLSCLDNDGSLTRAGTCRFRIVSWIVRNGEHAEATHAWAGEPLVVTLEADIVSIYAEVLEHPKKGSKASPSRTLYWRADAPLVVYPGMMRLAEAVEQPAHFAPTLGILSDSEDTVWYGVRFIAPQCRIVTHEVLERISKPPLVSTVKGPLLPDGFDARDNRVPPGKTGQGRAVRIDLPRLPTAVPLAVSDWPQGEPYPDLGTAAGNLPMVTERLFAADGRSLEREPVETSPIVSLAAQVTFMGSPAMVGAAFPEGLLDGYPTKDEAEGESQEPLHIHLAWNTVGFWGQFAPYPAATVPPQKWSLDSVYHNLYLLMNYLSHPERSPEGDTFPAYGNRFDPILFHSTVRGGRGFAHQLAAAKKRCALLVPLLGTSPKTNADDLLDMTNLNRLVSELQGVFYRARGHYAPVRPLGNISLSTFSGGIAAAGQFLRWALRGAPPVAGEAGEELMGEDGGELEGKAPAPSPELTEKLREIYLFDPPSAGNAGAATANILADATSWRAADPRRVVRLYTQANFEPKLLKRLLGGVDPSSNGVVHSRDGRVTVAVVPSRVWDATREAAIPAVHPSAIAPATKLGSHGYETGYHQWHQLFPNYFLFDALRRSHFTEEP